LKPETGYIPLLGGSLKALLSQFPSMKLGSRIPVAVNLKRTLDEFNVSVNREVLEVDESSWIGKLLTRGLARFFR